MTAYFRLMSMLCWALIGLSPAIGEAADRALVVGLDRYADPTLLKPLGGAVADARDIASTFEALGFVDVVTLENEQATRSALLAEIERLAAAAQPGDRVFFTFAGHGMRTPARAPETEDDGHDELFPLYGFSDRGHGLSEKILDDEIGQWVVRFGEKQVALVLVVDACHAGTTFRAVDRRVGGLRYRFAGEVVTEDIFAGLDLEPMLEEAGAPPGNLASFGAVIDSQLVPELLLPVADGTAPRGALSYFFARGARGAADLDDDGLIRFSEMKGYLERNISFASGGAQTPTIVAGDDDIVIVSFRDAAAEGQAPPSPTNSDALETVTIAEPDLDWPLRLAIVGTIDEDPELDGVEEVAAADQADLIWDVDRFEALSGLDTVVARGVSLARLQGVVDRHRAARRLSAMAERRALAFTAAPTRPAHKPGDLFGIRIDDRRAPFVTVFAIDADGKTALVDPLTDAEASPLPTNRGFEIGGFEAQSPFGADLLVGLETSAPPTALLQKLARLERDSANSGRPTAMAATEAVAAFLAQSQARLGLLTVYSCPREGCS
jgi:hypothetical protein